MLKKLREFLSLRSGAEKNGLSHDPVSALKKVYLTQLRHATQIRAHAQDAPYPHVAQQLNHVATEKMKACEALREALRKLGSYASYDAPVEIKSGTNHWERMSQDVHDQSELEQTLRELTGLLLYEAPETSELLSRMLAEEKAHREVLTGFLMRADPQAHQI